MQIFLKIGVLKIFLIFTRRHLLSCNFIKKRPWSGTIGWDSGVGHWGVSLGWDPGVEALDRTMREDPRVRRSWGGTLE